MSPSTTRTPAGEERMRAEERWLVPNILEKTIDPGDYWAGHTALRLAVVVVLMCPLFSFSSNPPRADHIIPLFYH